VELTAHSWQLNFKSQEQNISLNKNNNIQRWPPLAVFPQKCKFLNTPLQATLSETPVALKHSKTVIS
jgi:hypothetical protein